MCRKCCAGYMSVKSPRIYKNDKFYKKITCKATINGKGSKKKELTLHL